MQTLKQHVEAPIEEELLGDFFTLGLRQFDNKAHSQPCTEPLKKLKVLQELEIRRAVALVAEYLDVPVQSSAL
ncbi:hypothetical protein cyc_05164 [Cyclospora cayetanensis]|uniref:Uncharacterized protein n=1 Tax=Cyclospora cayetanensis TaxID=88456 RepID=A0A1D3D2C2_9EIME|nr:hypothetical protein cyc_05164 [Cyclospora cayetanensis]